MRKTTTRISAEAALAAAGPSLLLGEKTSEAPPRPQKTRAEKQAELKARQQAAYAAQLRGRVRWEDSSKYIAHDLGERRRKEVQG